MTKILKLAVVAVMVLGFASVCLAAQTNTITVKAVIPSTNGMTVTISQVVGTTFTPLAANDTMDFGTLTLDTVNHIYSAPFYFAVDIGVLNNSGAWTVQHTPASIYNRTTGNTSQNLDSNINVTFEHQLTDTTSSPLAQLSFLNSTRSVTNTDISTGWLRIYYGIGTGNTTTPDNPGVVPIPQTQVAGNYQGSVTLALTP